MMDRLVTREGVELELEDRELEETVIPFGVREVLEEFAEVQRLKRTAERPSPLWFTEFDPEANRRKAAAHYHAINTERGQAYKLERLRAQNEGKWQRVKADPERYERQKVSQRAYDARRREEARLDPEKHEEMKRRHRENYHRRRQDPARQESDRIAWRARYHATKKAGQ